MKLKTSLLLNVSPCICPLTFIIKIFCLLGSISAFSNTSILACIHDMLANKVHINFINGKCYIKQLKTEKPLNLFNQSHGLYHITTCNWLLMPLVKTRRHTYTPTHTLRCEPKQFQKIRYMWACSLCAWFNMEHL